MQDANQPELNDLPLEGEEITEYPATEANPEEEKFAAGAFNRIVRTMIAATVLLPGIAYFKYGSAVALSLFVGCLVSLFNFSALRKIIANIADQTMNARRARRLVVLRFLLRYGLVGMVFYAIFRSSAVNLYGLVLGLSLPVLAVFVEAGYEIIYAFRGR